VSTVFTVCALSAFLAEITQKLTVRRLAHTCFWVSAVGAFPTAEAHVWGKKDCVPFGGLTGQGQGARGQEEP